MSRRVIFDMAQERPQEPRRQAPQDHRCQTPGCTAWASYGLREPGIAGLRQPIKIWTCSAHRPETVNS
jgi:hypothetical protein